MWNLFKKRGPEDLGRLVSAYRCYLKVTNRTDSPPLAGPGSEGPAWKGGFGQAYQLFFKGWPTPNESHRFETIMERRLKKTEDLDRAFIQAINDYLGQKRVSPEELRQVVEEGRRLSQR